VPGSRHSVLAQCGLILLLMACGVAAQDRPAAVETVLDAPPSEALYATPTTVDRVGRVLAPVEINGRGPFRFILDTGANRSAIAQRVADTLGLPATDSSMIDVHGVTGFASVQAVRIASLRAGEIHVENSRLPVLPNHVFANADGILGVDGFKEARIEIDFVDDRVIVSKSTGRRSSDRAYSIPAQLRHGGLLLVKGRVGSLPVSVIIDTGAERTLGNGPLRDALIPRMRTDRTPQETTVIGATPDLETGVSFLAPSITVGDATVRNLPVTFGDLHVFKLWGLADKPALLIGMDLLGTLERIVIDYRRREFRWKAAPTDEILIPKCISSRCGTRISTDR